MHKGTKHFAAAVVMILLSGIGLTAQQDRGSITGIVRDPSRAVVPKAEVTVVRTETGVETKVLSSADGAYTFPSLHIGMYDLRVTMTGFKTAEAKGLHVVAGESVTMDLTLGS
jgi:hypothetical protein